MPLTKISGNQINPATEAIITNLSFLAQTSVLTLPSGTEANRPTGMSYGTIRYNTDNDQAEIYVADSGQGSPGWTDVGGGGPAIGEGSIIRTNGTNIQENLTVGPTANGGVEFTNGFSAGPIQIDSGYTVTIENGASWTLLGDVILSSFIIAVSTSLKILFIGNRSSLRSGFHHVFNLVVLVFMDVSLVNSV